LIYWGFWHFRHCWAKSYIRQPFLFFWCNILYSSTVFILLGQNHISVNRLYFSGATYYIHQPFLFVGGQNHISVNRLYFSGATDYIHQPFLFLGGNTISVNRFYFSDATYYIHQPFFCWGKVILYSSTGVSFLYQNNRFINRFYFSGAK
jgi:hypothetical protein